MLVIVDHSIQQTSFERTSAAYLMTLTFLKYIFLKVNIKLCKLLIIIKIQKCKLLFAFFSILCSQFCIASISSRISERLYDCFSLNENNCMTYIHTPVIIKGTVYPNVYIPSAKAIIKLS